MSEKFLFLKIRSFNKNTRKAILFNIIKNILVTNIQTKIKVVFQIILLENFLQFLDFNIVKFRNKTEI